MSCKPSDRRFTKGVFSEGKPQLSYHRCQDDDDDDDDDYGHDVEARGRTDLADFRPSKVAAGGGKNSDYLAASLDNICAPLPSKYI